MRKRAEEGLKQEDREHYRSRIRERKGTTEQTAVLVDYICVGVDAPILTHD